MIPQETRISSIYSLNTREKTLPSVHGQVSGRNDKSTPSCPASGGKEVRGGPESVLQLRCLLSSNKGQTTGLLLSELFSMSTVLPNLENITM